MSFFPNSSFCPSPLTTIQLAIGEALQLGSGTKYEPFQVPPSPTLGQHFIYFLTKGHLKLFGQPKPNAPYYLKYLLPAPNYFGEQVLFGDSLSYDFALAFQTAQISIFEAFSFQQYLQKEPHFGRFFWKNLTLKIGTMENRLKQIHQESVESRVLHCLSEIITHYGKKNRPFVSHNLLNTNEIAQLTCSTPFEVKQSIQQLMRKGKIYYDEKTIMVFEQNMRMN